MSQRVNFDTLVQEKKLTPDGKKWLTAALDIFHDSALDLRGMPDFRASRSFTSMLVESFEVTKPAGTVDKWDALIWLQPIMCTQGWLTETINPASGAIPYNHNAPGPEGTIGLLNVSTADAGTNLFPAGSAWAAGNGEMRSYKSTDTTQLQRIVATGFEVVNGTEPLNMSGLCTAGSYDCMYAEQTMRYYDTDATPWIPMDKTCITQKGPPKTLTDAKSNPGSRTWKASKGVYCPGYFVSQENPPKHPMNCGIQLSVPNSFNAYTVPSSDGAWVRDVASIPYKLSYAYFSGLSKETTLQVTYKVLNERYPGPGDVNYQNLTPSAVYDPRALQLYSAIIADMDLAVPQTDNPGGEFFRSILDSLNRALKAATPYASAYDPRLGIGVGAASLGVSAIKQIVDSRLAQSKQTIPGNNNSSVGDPLKKKKKKIPMKLTQKRRR